MGWDRPAALAGQGSSGIMGMRERPVRRGSRGHIRQPRPGRNGPTPVADDGCAGSGL